MSLPTIVVYSKSSNINVLRLKNKEIPTDLTSVDKVELRLDSGETLSSETLSQAIWWSVDPEKPGLLYLKLGTLFFTTRIYTVELMVFDPDNPLGIFWGLFRIRAIEESSSG